MAEDSNSTTIEDDIALLTLDEGERAALALGLQLKDDLILIDERRGAAIARQKGLEITRTLGILVRAAQRHMPKSFGNLDIVRCFQSPHYTDKPDRLRSATCQNCRQQPIGGGAPWRRIRHLLLFGRSRTPAARFRSDSS